MANLPLKAQQKRKHLEQVAGDAAALHRQAVARQRLAKDQLHEGERRLRTMDVKQKGYSDVVRQVDALESDFKDAEALASKRRKQSQSASQALTRVNNYLESNSGASFDGVTPPKPKAADSLESVRKRIAEAQAGLTRTASVRLDNETLKQQARELVDRLGREGKPLLKGLNGGGLSLGVVDGSQPLKNRNAALAIAAWMDPDRFVAALCRDIDALPGDGVSPDHAASERDHLAAELESLARLEEALIEAAEQSGQWVDRRHDFDPAAVLGVRPALRAKAA